MKNLYNKEVNQYRRMSKEVHEMYGGFGNENEGVFDIPIKPGTLKVIASCDGGWDHVSVSAYMRTPTWEEMELVKRIFFHPHELAIQFHVPEALHINCHPYCLHIWRPHNQDIELPPTWMVGPEKEK